MCLTVPESVSYAVSSALVSCPLFGVGRVHVDRRLPCIHRTSPSRRSYLAPIHDVLFRWKRGRIGIISTTYSASSLPSLHHTLLPQPFPCPPRLPDEARPSCQQCRSSTWSETTQRRMHQMRRRTSPATCPSPLPLSLYSILPRLLSPSSLPLPSPPPPPSSPLLPVCFHCPRALRCRLWACVPCSGSHREGVRRQRGRRRRGPSRRGM